MSIFSRKPLGGGIMDVIRCDEPSYLIWKWHPEGTQSGNNRKENAIRLGSSLRVKDGSVAVFVYSRDGSIHHDYIEGPFDGLLQTANLPVISRILGLTYQGESPFPAEIYFINLAQMIQIRFAVPYFDIFDPRFLDFSVPTAVRGTISFHITDYHSFIQLHRLDTFSMEDFQNQIKDAVTRNVKAVIANIPEETGIPVVQLERKIEQINDIVQNKIISRFASEFGVTVSSIDIAVIDIDKTSDGYQQLKGVTQDLTSVALKAKNAVDITEMQDNQRLRVLEREGRILSDIEEDAYARRKQTQTANLNAYQTEVQGQVGIAGAQGLGKMSSGNSGIAGFNPSAVIAGVTIGGALGQNIAGNINSVMSGTSSPLVSQVTNTPPPIPKASYNIVINGQSTGPYEITAMKSMIAAGLITAESLVWTSGMSEWKKANEITELKSLFIETPPIPQS